ncbi:MAG TPA: uracil-DNA glycosylase [Desulfotomaculum sp.]|nr:uracil-DNA glycosylase [Desulfotomaculum sp.]
MLFGDDSLFSDPAWDLSKIDNMASLEEKVKTCTRCNLRAGCRGAVFGEGNPGAQVVLCGEGPGADEDLLGRPFVGRAGQLLDKILEACGFERFVHVYILNIVKCRPPGNRTPTEEETTACRHNLNAQLRILRPRVLILLGAVALQALLDPKGKITKARGHWVERNGLFVMPTYHPAALLRNPSLKRDSWEDFKQVVAKYREFIEPGHYSPHC